MADIGAKTLPPVQLFDANGNLIPPDNGISVTGQGSGAASAAVATLAASTTGRTTYISGLQVTGLGATSAGSATITFTGVGIGPFTIPVPLGATVALVPVLIPFYPPVPATAPNTAIVATLSSLGAGNTSAQISTQGFQA